MGSIVLANDEMLEGYRDGRDLSAPEPTENRSYSYRHGFKVGRADRMGKPAFDGAHAARRNADAAIAMDELISGAAVRAQPT